MAEPANDTGAKEALKELSTALQSELDQLKKARCAMTLCSGEAVGSFAGYSLYRFELPENTHLRGIVHLTLELRNHHPVKVKGRIVGVQNQYVTLALPLDFDAVLPEIKCTWTHEEHVQPVLDQLSKTSAENPLTRLLFEPNDEANKSSPHFEPLFAPSLSTPQQEAIARILNHRVSYVAGPVRSGKSTLLAALMANSVKAGKSVLYLAMDGEQVDESLMLLQKTGEEVALDVIGATTRFGLSSTVPDGVLAAVSHEHAVETLKAEKRKTIQDKVLLLEQYWKVTIQQSLHQDYYSKLAELHGKAASYKQQLDAAERELAAAKESIARVERASIMDRLRKGFSKDDLTNAQRQLREKEAVAKRIQSTYQALTNEVLRWEVRAPVSNEDIKAYRAAVKKIDELGGPQVLVQEVERALAVDEGAILGSKKCVMTTVPEVLASPLLSAHQFDVVIVDEAEAASLPELAALSGRAKEQFIIAGDPFQPGPESFSNSPAAQQWLQRSIFSVVMQSDEFDRIFSGGGEKADWMTFLNSQYGGASKLSQSLHPILFQDKVSLAAAPKPKGRLFFIDTSGLKSSCKQYVGRKKILPHNDLQTRKVVEVVKHAVMEPHRLALDVGIIYPFPGPSLYTKLQLRVHGIRNVEVGTPATFRHRKKKAIILDTTMAGVDYTLRSIDDRKIGQSNIARLFYTILSCVEEDLYVVADLSHFSSVYKDRLFTKLLMLLQADSNQIYSGSAAKKFDDLEWDKRALLMVSSRGDDTGAPRDVRKEVKTKMDLELELRIKRMEKKEGQKPQIGVRDYSKEIYRAVQQVLGMLEDINLLSQYVGGDVLFRRSLSTEAAAARLRIDVCEKEDDFSSVMEHWNLLIYEMSGAGRTDSAYFAKQTPEARVRWDINNLKAYYGSDIQAVIEEGKQRIAVVVSKLFQDAVSKPQPSNPTEWSTAYLFFLSKLEAYLEWISEQLRKWNR